IAALLRGLRIGVVSRQVGKLLALAGTSHQILCFFLNRGASSGAAAFGGKQDLTQEYPLIAHKFRLVLVVVFPLLLTLHVDPSTDLLPDDALREHSVLG